MRSISRGLGRSPLSILRRRVPKTNLLLRAIVRVYATLERLADHFNVDIVQSTEYGGGEKVVLSDPDGLGIEVFYGMERIAAPARDASALNNGFDKPRQNRLQRFGKAAGEWQAHDGRLVYELMSKVMRLGHTAINVADPKKSMDWYANRLGF